MAGLSAGHTICGIVRINGGMPVPERKKRYSSSTVCQQMLIDIIEEISVGTVIVLVSSLIAWLYHIRQLYATAPVLFQNASEGKDDAIYQIIVSNRGNQVEENVRVELDPSVSAEIVAANLSGVVLENSVIRIERIHKKQEVNLLLRVKNARFDFSKILSVSSNETTGKICKSPRDIPFNYGISALVVSVLIGIFPILYYAGQVVEYIDDRFEEKNLKAVSNQGWSNLDDYQESDLRQSYSDNEFPVRLVGIKKKADYSGTAIPAGLKDIWNQLDEKKSVLLKYEINNKTASDLGVLAFRKGVRNAMPFYRNVSPLSKETIFIPVKTVPASGIIRTEFMFRLNDEWLDRIDHSVNTGTLKETTGHLKQTVINPKPGKSQVALQ